MTAATRVVISYPADLSAWSRRQLETRWYRAYLRRTIGEASPGHEWIEFVDVGCCGSAYDVPLRIEAVEGGSAVGPDTAVEFTARKACGVLGGWRVQSAAGPTR